MTADPHPVPRVTSGPDAEATITMNNNLPLANPVNPTSITSNPQILLANRAHRTLVRSRQTRDRYRLLPEDIKSLLAGIATRAPWLAIPRCFGYLSCRGPQTLTVDFGPS